MQSHSTKAAFALILGIVVLLSFSSCSGSTVSIVVTPTNVPTSTTMPTTIPIATNTSAPVAGVCNPADFPVGSSPVGTKQNGPPTTDFQYPPLTYYLSEGGAAGNHVDIVCSSGNAASIYAFMKASIPAGGWKIIPNTIFATSFSAEKPTSPPSGDCYSLDLTVGGKPLYPGEWEINFHPPASTCS